MKLKQPKIPAGNPMNKPFRAAEENGHGLNESYKLPVPNASGVNHSYMRPAIAGGGASTAKLSARQNKPAGPVQMGKNPY